MESLFNKVADLQAWSFIKKRLQHELFPVKFAKFLRTYILKKTCKRLDLNYLKSMLCPALKTVFVVIIFVRNPQHRIKTTLMSSSHWKTFVLFACEWKRTVNINSKLSQKSYRKTNYPIQNSSISWYVMLFSHCFFWLKNWKIKRFSNKQ